MSDLSVRDVELVLSHADIPLRGGEIADWAHEAKMLMDAADPNDANRTIKTLVRYRLSGVPLAYLVGSERFLGRQYAVEPGVVIPHPASELLAAVTISALSDAQSRVRTPQLLEVGVGVGNISVSCLAAVEAAVAHGSDLQGAALRLTALNARALLRDPKRLRLYQAFDTQTATEPFLHPPVGDIDVVAANPPYLVEGDPVSEATKRSGVAHFSYAPVDDPSWCLRSLLSAPRGFLSQDCAIVMECALSYQAHHQTVMEDSGWDARFFSREEFAESYGFPSLASAMTPSPHRVMCATRGKAALVAMN